MNVASLISTDAHWEAASFRKTSLLPFSTLKNISNFSPRRNLFLSGKILRNLAFDSLVVLLLSYMASRFLPSAILFRSLSRTIHCFSKNQPTG